MITHPFRRFARAIAGVAALAAAVGSAHAAAGELAKFEFTTNPSSSANWPAPQDSTYRVGFATGAGFSSAGSDAGWSSNAGGNLFARALRNSSPNAAILTVGGSSLNSPADEAVVAATNNYFAFTVAPEAGYQLDLSSVSVSVGSQRLANAGGTTAAFTAQFFLRSSVDDYATTLASARTSTAAGSTASGNEWTTLQADFSDSVAFTGLTGSVTFQLYAYITTTEASQYQVIRIDDFVINGVTQVIPEPGSAAVVVGGIALLVIGFTRRRR